MTENTLEKKDRPPPEEKEQLILNQRFTSEGNINRWKKIDMKMLASAENSGKKTMRMVVEELQRSRKLADDINLPQRDADCLAGLISLGIVFTKRVTLAIVQQVDHLPSVVGLDHD